jgi:hypothetical protein
MPASLCIAIFEQARDEAAVFDASHLAATQRPFHRVPPFLSVHRHRLEPLFARYHHPAYHVVTLVHLFFRVVVMEAHVFFLAYL